MSVCNYFPIWAIFFRCPFGQFLNIPFGQYCPFGQFLGDNFFTNFDHFEENQIPHGAANLRKKRSPQLDSPQKIKGLSFPPRIHVSPTINSVCYKIMYFDLRYVLTSMRWTPHGFVSQLNFSQLQLKNPHLPRHKSTFNTNKTIINSDKLPLTQTRQQSTLTSCRNIQTRQLVNQSQGQGQFKCVQ